MIKRLCSLVWVLTIVLLLSACRNSKQTGTNQDLPLANLPSDKFSNARLIFYKMYLPPEMSRIFERAGVNYSPSVLNEPDNFARYQEPHKIALNLGVYGVDLSYTRMFDQKTLTASYLSAIQFMASKLGIPKDYYEGLLNGIERNYEYRDSVTLLAGKIYANTDEYLKQNDHDSYAALIIAGGWIEGLYISTRILESEPDNVEMSDRIAEQKYALNSLISLLSNYQDESEVNEVLLLLKGLKRSFDKFEIYYGQEDFVLDTVKKSISASEYDNRITPEIEREIGQLISGIRNLVIN